MIKIKNKGDVDPYEIAKEYALLYPILKKGGELKDGYLVFLDDVKRQGIDIDISKISESLARLSKENASVKQFKQSYVEGIRQGVLTTYEQTTKGKKCQLLGTDAEVPRIEHALLEGDIFDCDYLLNEIISDFGCQHAFKIL